MTDVVQQDTVAEPAPVSRGTRITRIVRVVGWTSMGIGLFLLGFVVHQLFVTTYFAQQNNEVLEARAVEYFDTAEITEVVYTPPGAPNLVDPADPTGTVDPPAARGTLLVEEPPEKGDPFAIIRIPSIERLKDGWTVVEGVSRNNLKNGVGHMPSTPLPGQPGNSVLPGHRTTYGAPFHELDALEVGDIIEVETALGVNVFKVRESIIVRPTEIWVTGYRPGSWITLSTCNPKFSSRERLIIFAELIDGPNFDVIYDV